MKTLYAEISLEKEELEKIGSAHPITLEYYRTRNAVEKEGSIKYGIEVVKKIDLIGRIDIEAKHIKDICNCEYLTNSLLEKLKNSKVTPMILEDVTEDLMKQFGIA